MREYELCVSSRLANLAQIAEFVSDRARGAGLSETQVLDVQMAVDEACTNAMEHAYGGRSDGEVRVCCYVEEDDFVVRVTDHGALFDPSLVPAPDTAAPIEERNIGGLGLFFMRQMVDVIEFGTDHGRGNQITMRKHRRLESL